MHRWQNFLDEINEPANDVSQSEKMICLNTHLSDTPAGILNEPGTSTEHLVLQGEVPFSLNIFI